jgi:hypothetical protein
VEGGTIYFHTWTTNESNFSDEHRTIVSESGMNSPSSQAADHTADGFVEVHIDGTTSGTWTIDYVTIVDDAGHTSNEEACSAEVP